MDGFGKFKAGSEIDTARHVASGMFGNFGMIAFSGILGMVGFGLTIAGAIMLIVAHRRGIVAYQTQQAMPVIKEGVEKITSTIAKSAEDVAKGISRGIKEGKKDPKE